MQQLINPGERNTFSISVRWRYPCSTAATLARKAAALGWRNATFAYHRGMIRTSLGRAADARAALSQALAINPHFSPLAAPRARQTLAELGGPR